MHSEATTSLFAHATSSTTLAPAQDQSQQLTGGIASASAHSFGINCCRTGNEESVGSGDASATFGKLAAGANAGVSMFDLANVPVTQRKSHRSLDGHGLESAGTATAGFSDAAVFKSSSSFVDVAIGLRLSPYLFGGRFFWDVYSPYLGAACSGKGNVGPLPSLGATFGIGGSVVSGAADPCSVSQGEPIEFWGVAHVPTGVPLEIKGELKAISSASTALDLDPTNSDSDPQVTTYTYDFGASARLFAAIRPLDVNARYTAESGHVYLADFSNLGPVPEPQTWALLCTGLIALMTLTRRRPEVGGTDLQLVARNHQHRAF
jgi:hypothetical protein